MNDGSTQVQVLIEDLGWHRAMRSPDLTVRRAAAAVGCDASVVLTSDRVVKQLNARHRGINKPTNVLTFDPVAPGHPGELVLALGVLKREAAAAGIPLRHHLAHLIVHGALHLQGYDHDHAGAARCMEQREAALLGRLRLRNPWKRT